MKRVGWLLLTAITAVILVACGGGTPPLDPIRTISGTVRNWEGGTATVQPVRTDEDGEIVGRLETTGTIAANGSFELTLPATVESGLLETLPLCDGEFTGNANPSTWQEMFAELAVIRDGEETGVLLLTNSQDVFFNPQAGDMAAFRLYVDRAVTIQGTCVTEQEIIDYDATLRQGWNLVTIEFTETAQEVPFRARARSVATVPAGLDWYYLDFSALAGMSLTSLLQ